MHSITVAKDGKVSCGSCFTSYHDHHVPATLSLQQGSAASNVVEPDEVAFSAFDVSRPGGRAAHMAGGHVALAYNSIDSFFTVAVVRCDTWAVQWAVRRAELLADATVSHLTMLCANTVCGVATSSGQQRVFVASRFDTITASRAENKEWRQFLASPRSIDVGVEAEGIVAVAAFDKNSFLVVTAQGTLVLVRLNTSLLRSTSTKEASFVRVETLQAKVHKAAAEAQLVVYREKEEENHVYAAFFVRGTTALQILQFSSDAQVDTSATPSVAVLEVATKVPIETVTFAGPFHVCVCAASATANVQFISLIPGAETVETLAFDPLTAPHAPLGAYYHAAAEQLVLLSSSATDGELSALSSATKSGSLIAAPLSLAAGPATAAALRDGTWRFVCNPFRHHGPQTRRATAADEEDVRILEDAPTRRNGRWTPVSLAYALATATSDPFKPSSHPAVAIFVIETAPFLHTRLIKQWHNAAAGLQSLLLAASAKAQYKVLALPWNPRHVRRALRLLTRAQLSSLLHCTAAAVNACERFDSAVTYAAATTSAIEFALQTITLARQMGAVLDHADVAAVAVLLRAARDGGHELLRYTSRMELLMESALQQRAMDRVLGRRESASTEADAKHELQRNFYGIAAELQTERTLHTRYAANAWAQHLVQHAAEYQAEASAAVKLLAATQGKSQPAKSCVLSDWKRIGTAPHQDPLLERFEEALL